MLQRLDTFRAPAAKIFSVTKTALLSPLLLYAITARRVASGRHRDRDYAEFTLTAGSLPPRQQKCGLNQRKPCNLIAPNWRAIFAVISGNLPVLWICVAPNFRSVAGKPCGRSRTARSVPTVTSHERVGSPRAFRAVGQANHNNPVPIIVPCHRVIGSNGTLTGYGGGLGIKEKLLELEQISSQSRFFSPNAIFPAGGLDARYTDPREIKKTAQLAASFLAHLVRMISCAVAAWIRPAEFPCLARDWWMGSRYREWPWALMDWRPSVPLPSNG